MILVQLIICFFASATQFGEVEVFNPQQIQSSSACYSKDVFNDLMFCIFPIRIICDNQVVAQTPACRHSYRLDKVFAEHDQSRQTVEDFMGAQGFELLQRIYGRTEISTYLKSKLNHQ